MERQAPEITQQMHEQVEHVMANMAGVIRGKPEAIELSMVALLAGGHLLLEDIPGVGKTMLAIALARSIRCSYRRIQFTNDTIPADILGMMVYSRKEETFRFVAGPIFAGIVLADEINRTSPKTQSAMLEAMTDGKVSIENKVYTLPDPFMVIATQNPVEHHGAFPLPESQLDRFLLRVPMGYPDRESEKAILRENLGPETAKKLDPVIDDKAVLALRQAVRDVVLEDSVLEYILSLTAATRAAKQLEFGVSPRGSLMLKQAAQALAFVRGRDYVLPDDVKRLILPVWAHRIRVEGAGLTERTRRIEAETILEEATNAVSVPI